MISTGIALVNMVNNRLLGYRGAVTNAQILEYLNEAQDEVWTVLKALQKDYFGQLSQYTDPTAPYYFGPLQTNNRVYTLPSNFASMRFVEPLQQGYEQIVFKFVEIDSPEFQSARRAANVDQSLTPTVEYWYTIFGKNQFILAVYPEATMNIVMYYIRTLNDLVCYNSGTATTGIGTTDVTLIGTSYSAAQMATMVGAEFFINGFDFGTIAAGNAGTQHLTLTTNAPSTQTGQRYVVSGPIDQLVDPWTEKIADYAVKKILLSAQDVTQWDALKEEWNRDILTLQTSASSRNDADAEFVQDLTE